MDKKKVGLDVGIFKGKRGQLTVFIIVGILVLFVFAGIMYAVKTTRKVPLLAEEEPVIAKVPVEFAPVQEYTENCLKDIGKRGLVLLGQQGGYISPELVGEYSADTPVDVDGLDLGATKVPYWHYNSEPNTVPTVIFATLQPKLYAKEDAEMSIEAQLSRFVEEKLDGCLQGYGRFGEQGFVVDVHPAKEVEVRIGEESVGFLLQWEVTAERSGARHAFDLFYVKIPLQLKQMYEIASLATQAERNYTYLERQALDLLSIYSGTGEDSLPPTYDVQDGFTGKHWLVPDVKKAFQELVGSHVPLLRFLGSSNSFSYTYPQTRRSQSYQSFYDSMAIPLDAGSFSVRFDYFDWPMYFYLQKEPLVKSQELLFTNPLGIPPFTIAMQRYRNKYDVSYPVLVTLRDEEAFGGQGYAFLFALEANIRNNHEVKSGNTQIKLPPTARSQICNTNKRTSEIIKTIVVDSSTKEPLEAVRLGLSIPEEQDCFIGVTDGEGEVESTYPLLLGGQLSLVKEGYLQNFYPINTLEYKEEPGIFGYAVSELAEPALELHPLKKIKVSVQKKPLGKCVTPLVCEYTGSLLAGGFALTTSTDVRCINGAEQCFFSRGLFRPPGRIAHIEVNSSLTKNNDYYFFPQTVLPLEEKDQATITFTRVADLVPAAKSAPYTAIATVQGSQQGEIELVPGIYKVNGFLTYNGEVLIPKDERRIQYEVLAWESEQRFDVDENRLPSYLSGQVVWDTPETYLKITPEELYGNEELTLYLPSQELHTVPLYTTTIMKDCAALTCITEDVCIFQACGSQDVPINGRIVEDLNMISQMESLSKTYRTALLPKWS